MLKLFAGTALVAMLAQTAPHSGMQHKHKPQVVEATPTTMPAAKSISEKGVKGGPAPDRPSPRPSPKAGVKF
jgi:hypothetical protein